MIITTRCINFTSNDYAAIAMYVVFAYTYQIVEKEKLKLTYSILRIWF